MSLEIPDKINKAFTKDKTINTYNTYKVMLSKLFKEEFDTDIFSIKKLENTDRINKYINSLTLTSKKLLTIAIVMILKAANASQKLIDFYGKLARQYRIEDKAVRKNRQATAEEMLWHITWDWVKELYKEYKYFLFNINKDDITELAYNRLFMGYVVFSLLTRIPPQRGECLFNCYIDRNVPGANTIDLNKKQWIIRQSKTKRSYGERIIPLPDDIVKIIKEWKEMSNCNEKLLLCNDQGGKMSTQSYTQFLNNTLFRTGASRFVSTDDLRKSYVTHMIVHVGVNDKEREDMANLLGHSSKTMMELYFKPLLEDGI